MNENVLSGFCGMRIVSTSHCSHVLFSIHTSKHRLPSYLRGVIWGFCCFSPCVDSHVCFPFLPARVLIKKSPNCLEVLSGAVHTVCIYWDALVVFLEVDLKNWLNNIKITLCFQWTLLM